MVVNEQGENNRKKVGRVGCNLTDWSSPDILTKKGTLEPKLGGGKGLSHTHIREHSKHREEPVQRP